MKLTLTVKDRAEWRAWLEQHGLTEIEVWLVFYKKNSGVSSVSYEEAVEEALCFGWVDSLVQRIDDTRYAQKFTPRQPKSKWSESNRKRVARLAAQGLMTPAGLAVIPFEITAPDDSPIIPHRFPPLSADLAHELEAHPEALAFFQSLAPSQQRLYSGWIMDAKKEATRHKRLQEAIRMLKQGQLIGLK